MSQCSCHDLLNWDWECGQTFRRTDVGGKGPAAALLHEITEKNTARKFMLLPLCVHAVREQAERKLIRCDQSHAQDEASGEELCAHLEEGGVHVHGAIN